MLHNPCCVLFSTNPAYCIISSFPIQIINCLLAMCLNLNTHPGRLQVKHFISVCTECTQCCKFQSSTAHLGHLILASEGYSLLEKELKIHCVCLICSLIVAAVIGCLLHMKPACARNLGSEEFLPFSSTYLIPEKS